MKRICLAALLATVALSSSGCCLFDKLFCCPRGYPLSPPPCGCGACGSGGAPCGGSCGPACAGGYCPAPGCCDGANAGPGPGACPGGYCAAGYGGQQVGGLGRPLCANKYVPTDSGPPSGAIAYPYYTTRGPRDFLARNPGSIGP